MMRFVFPFLLFFFYLTFQPIQTQSPIFLQKRIQHIPKTLTDEETNYLANLSNLTYTEEILDNILIPRVVGSPGHQQVFRYIVEELRKQDWYVEIDEFKDKTPNFGELTFQNIVASLNPNAERYLVLACHYDSKYFATEEFVGATDSAVPCAMMLNLIAVMKEDLEKIRKRTDLSLKLIFFDGEEAFRNWGPTDSIYGARHLAEKYSKQHLIVKSTNEEITDLHRIDLFILLDLLGAPDPRFYSYFRDTEKWYVRLLSAEECLSDLNQLKGLSKRHRKRYFQTRSSPAQIEDDHIPFLIRGVPILHIIPTPFPKGWHTPEDNRELIDPDTTEDLNKILRVFVAEYLHLLLEDAKDANIPEKEL